MARAVHLQYRKKKQPPEEVPLTPPISFNETRTKAAPALHQGLKATVRFSVNPYSRQESGKDKDQHEGPVKAGWADSSSSASYFSIKLCASARGSLTTTSHSSNGEPSARSTIKHFVWFVFFHFGFTNLLSWIRL